jgi:serine/threonine protein phosphatase PrpC
MNKASLTLDPIVIDLALNAGKGEDAHFVDTTHPHTQFIGVFDGMGGHSAGYDDETGGRIAAQTAAEETRHFFQQLETTLTQKHVTYLRNKIWQVLQEKAKNIKSSRLKSSLLGKRLSTTLALVKIPAIEDAPVLDIAWIGDSRIYFLSPRKGLQKLTRDDSKANDESDFRYIDSPLSQHLTADMPTDWEIHFKRQEVEASGLVIACTDGGFDNLEFPWDFEILLLASLFESETLDSWKSLLTTKYQASQQDDISLIISFLGVNANIHALKSLYHQRISLLRQDFDSANKPFDPQVKWEMYQGYYTEKLMENANLTADAQATPVPQEPEGASNAKPLSVLVEPNKENPIAVNSDTETKQRTLLPLSFLSFALLQLFLILGFVLGWLTSGAVVERKLSSAVRDSAENVDNSSGSDVTGQSELALLYLSPEVKQLASENFPTTAGQIKTIVNGLTELMAQETSQEMRKPVDEQRSVAQDEVVKTMRKLLTENSILDGKTLEYAGTIDVENPEAKGQWIEAIALYQKRRVGLSEHYGYIDPTLDLKTSDFLRCDIADALEIALESRPEVCPD